MMYKVIITLIIAVVCCYAGLMFGEGLDDILGWDYGFAGGLATSLPLVVLGYVLYKDLTAGIKFENDKLKQEINRLKQEIEKLKAADDTSTIE